jgi:hypothetical protein
MVMRNRSDGSNTPHWWDDLPPKVRNRFTRPAARTNQRNEPNTDEADDAGPPRPLGRGELVSSLTALAALFALITAGIMLYLIVVARYVTG